ncbi:Re/Si-specific NAD(P)(+) transhydrogenase subunit alpha [Fulvivirgaceae bacterium BMA10]|uniref:proton-translocating NAD(P)(+) transhydrogenase n=1 Tax=Splendidivirga corallicola TaxID=3051826 RepID=A0ABT8KPH8_9BACT|nr:Re/Si-specific NAD(P)(+) transhydrogenase subunit alpha [Fulvivirgaceae bacterium BMA10]
MHIGIPKETQDGRVSIIPDIVKKLVEEKNEVYVETLAGKSSSFSDADYTEAGAKIVSRDEVFKSANLIISIHPLSEEELAKLSKGVTVVSLFQPFADDSILDKISKHGLTAFSMDMIPRITLAQAMDVLSSQASVAGYKAVLKATDYLPRYFPMLTTAAGSIPPAKVLILGAGVAGLQAIATAKRNGAVVEAFDTRLAAKEEVESLGAKFVMVEGATDDTAAGGYAVEQSEEYKQKQRELIQEKASKADVVITTAQLRGKPAPLLVTKETVDQMKSGAVIVDLASSTGGNCELTKDEEIINHNGVTIIGSSNLAAEVSQHASQLYSKNMHNFLKVILKEGEANYDMENEIATSSCIVLEGTIRYGNN